LLSVKIVFNDPRNEVKKTAIVIIGINKRILSLLLIIR